MTGSGGRVGSISAGIFMRAVKTPTKLRMKLIMTVLPTEFGMALIKMNFIDGGYAPALRASDVPIFPNGMMNAITKPMITDKMMFEA